MRLNGLSTSTIKIFQAFRKNRIEGARLEFNRVKTTRLALELMLEYEKMQLPRNHENIRQYFKELAFRMAGHADFEEQNRHTLGMNF